MTDDVSCVLGVFDHHSITSRSRIGLELIELGYESVRSFKAMRDLNKQTQNLFPLFLCYSTCASNAKWKEEEQSTHTGSL